MGGLGELETELADELVPPIRLIALHHRRFKRRLVIGNRPRSGRILHVRLLGPDSCRAQDGTVYTPSYRLAPHTSPLHSANKTTDESPSPSGSRNGPRSVDIAASTPLLARSR